MLEIKELDNSSVNKEELLKLNLYQRREEIGRELNAKEIRRSERQTDWLFNSYI